MKEYKKNYKLLKLWLSAQEKTINEFADYIQVSRSHLSRIINGKVFPSKQLDFVIWHCYEDIEKNGWN